MNKKCPVCGNNNTHNTYPFGYLYCGNCKYDEEFNTPEEYKNKLREEKLKKKKENTILAWHRWYEDDHYGITECLYQREDFIRSEFTLAIYEGNCMPINKYKFEMDSMGRETFIKLKNMKSNKQKKEHIEYLINKTGHLTKLY